MRPCVLEVERRFSGLTLLLLTRCAGSPPFAFLRPLTPTMMHDVYFDTRDDGTGLLSANGVWVRQRNGHWQAKLGKGGDLTNSRFHELLHVSDIAACIRRILPSTATAADLKEDDNFGLVPMADFTTLRESWAADIDFTIVRDTTDFNHQVGKVELQVSLPGDASEEAKTAKMREMDERIRAFMGRYHWAFVPGEPVGKLTAWFVLQRLKKNWTS